MTAITTSELFVPDLPVHVQNVYNSKPKWVDREIIKPEAIILAKEISDAKAVSAIEIGVASGFSSAVIYSCLRNNDPDAKLYAFDLATDCYFDDTKRTGQAFQEIHGNTAAYKLQTDVTSADIPDSTPNVDFLFIDAGHRHPWPTLDLLSLHRFVSHGCTVGLHDVNWPLQHKGAYRQNGPRDLIRTWMGKKRIYKIAPNIGFVRVGKEGEVFESLCRSLISDWDTEIDDATLAKYLPMAERFGKKARARLEQIFDEKKSTVAKTRLFKLKS